MENSVQQICEKYSKRFKVEYDANVLRCFSSLYEVLVLYDNHEHCLKSTENLPTSLSSFRYSKSASLREFASQMTLDVQGSSSEEFLNVQSTSSDTISGNIYNNNRCYSTQSLSRVPNTDDQWSPDDDQNYDSMVSHLDQWGSSSIRYEVEEEDSNDKYFSGTAHKRYLSLGSNLQNISEELADSNPNNNSGEEMNKPSNLKSSFDTNTITFIDDLFKGVWERETLETESALDLAELPKRQDTLRSKYDRSKTIELGSIEKNRYTLERNPRKSRNRWLFGFGWMFKSSKKLTTDSDSEDPITIINNTIKMYFRLKRSLKKRKLQEDIDILKEIAVKQASLKSSFESYGAVRFDLLTLQDDLGRYYSIMMKYSKRHLSKNSRNVLMRLYAFYSRTYFLQTVTKVSKFRLQTEKFCRSVSSLF